MGVYQPGYLKSRNRKLVFDLFLEQNELSKAEIVKMTGMSFPTVSKTAEYLLQRSIVQETDIISESDTGLGRKGRVLRFNPDAFHAIGAEFEGSFVEIGRMNLQGEVREHVSFRFDILNRAPFMDKLVKTVQSMIDSAPCPVLGIGMGLPFYVDPNTNETIGVDESDTRIPKSFNAMFGPLIDAVNIPVLAENDVNLAGLGEVFFRRKTKDALDLIFLSLGTGFGAGLVLNGHLWQGANCRAGEVGGTLLGPLTKGQAPESLESKINIAAINKAFNLRLEEDGCLSGGLDVQVINMLLPHLKTAILNLHYIFDIEQFVLSGYIPRLLGDGLYNLLNEEITVLLSGRRRDVSIKRPTSPHSVLVGGASMVFEQTIFEELQNE